MPDPRASAVALAYRPGADAPQVVAKGRGFLAEAIIAKAREHGVYVHESSELVSLLMRVDLDQHIPPQLYLAVAELLAWLYRLDKGETLHAEMHATSSAGSPDAAQTAHREGKHP